MDEQQLFLAGRATAPANDDQRFASEKEAIQYAQRWCLGDAVWAVWRQDAEDVFTTICLVYQGDEYRQ